MLWVTFFRSSLLILAVIAKQLEAAPAKFSSFGIRSVIYVEDETIHLSERYSVAQSRARMRYNNEDSSEMADIFFDGQSQVGVAISVKKKNCMSLTNELLASVVGKALRLDGKLTKDLFAAFGNTQDSVLYAGPSKILYYLANEGSKMRLVETSDEQISTTRNRPSIEYQLEVQLADDKAIISAYYDRENYSQDSTRFSVPLQVSVRFSGPNSLSSANFTIAFFTYEFIEDDKIQSLHGDLADINKDVVLDEFAFPTSYDCSGVMPESLRQDLFEGQKALNARLTFEAKSLHSFSREFENFVAFDGTLETVRIDSRRNMFTGIERARDSMQIWDYGLNHKYIVIDADVKSMDEFEPQTTSKCTIMQMDNPKTSRPRLPSLSGFLVGAEKFTYMGRARVRGVDALVYETRSNAFPVWFSQPMLYLDKNGKYMFRNLTKRVQEKPEPAFSEDAYTAVVYVAKDSSEKAPKKLLKLEFYDRFTSKSSRYRLELGVDFSNFAYGLTDSPVGDRANELFSLKDFCAAGSGTDRYAEVNMLLEESPDSVGVKANWLSQPNDRNQALLLGLNNIMKTMRTMVYDFSSKLVALKKRSISVSFKVAEHPKFVTWVAFYGNAGLRLSNTRRFIVDSLTDCLWIVGERKGPSYVHYDGAGLCTLDESARVDPATNKFSSDLVFLDPNQYGELYLVAAIYDTDVSMTSAWLRNENSRHLENRAVVLQNVKSKKGGKQIEPDPITMRIQDIKITNVDFMSRSLGNQQILPPARSFAGFTLNELSEENRRLVNEVDRDIPLSKDQCRAACLEDLDCRSYSFCVEGVETRCIVTNTSFMAPGIREHLSSRDALQLRSGSTVEVKTDTGKVTLERSLRCDLYNKFYSELFKRSMHMKRDLNGLNLTAANNEEECANICFTKSIEVLKKDSALKSRIKSLIDNPDLKRDNLRDNFMSLLSEHKNITSEFCRTFLYLDVTTSSEATQAFLEDRFHQPKETTGYCGSISASPQSDASARDRNGELFVFEEYQFDYTLLYEAHFGYGLQKTPLTGAEQRALKEISQANPTDSANHEILKEAVAAGKNFQVQNYQVDPRSCAQMCFSQSAGPWPACRSFDVIAVPFKYGRQYTCVLNSEPDTADHLTSADSEDSETFKVWHYRPRFGLAQQEAEQAYDLDALADRFASVVSAMKTFTLNGFFTFVVVVLAIGTGLFLGVRLARRRIAGRPTNIEVEECLSDIA